MASISVLFSTVMEKANIFNMELNYSEPKIYIGVNDATKWSSIS